MTLMPCPLLVFKQTRDAATGQVTRTDLVATGATTTTNDHHNHDLRRPLSVVAVLTTAEHGPC